jgi:hypothetical protein
MKRNRADAVEIRYPESSAPSVEETNRAIRTAGEVFKLIQRKVSNRHYPK